MKKGILFLLAIFTMISFVEANNSKHPTEVFGFENRYNDNAVTFIERGVRFHIYLNGDFDFDSRYFRTRGNRRIRISRDYNGRINRVGNIWIDYDFRGNVRKIGQVRMRYQRGRLARVGHLRITYNGWGDPRFYGEVRFNDYYQDYYYDNNFSVGFNINLGTVCVYNDSFFYGNEFRNNYRAIRQDANFIYYRANNGATVSRDRILKRRRPSTTGNQTTRPQNDRRDVKKRSIVNKRRTQTSSIKNKKRRSVDNTNQRRTIQRESTNVRKPKKKSVTRKKKRVVTTESRSTSKKRAKTQSKKRRRS